MKKIIQIFYLFSAFSAVAVLSCQKQPLEGEYKGISIEQNGIGIEFYLLNENSEPDTVFYEGENFKFHLAIENNVEPDTSMFIVSEFLRNSDLFMVFRSEDDTLGKPIEWGVMNKISDAPNQIIKGEIWVMEIPWHETRGTEEPFDFENLIHVFQHFFMGLDQQYLVKGRYYTKFTQVFCLGRHHDSPEHNKEPIVCTDTLTLKINFEIK